ncbi:hypothetical protein DTO169E5_4693 [Paecilomyces variotii]|nr:hypothetical protein DTO169E5_4693 [Paecilomyces variotii]
MACQLAPTVHGKRRLIAVRAVRSQDKSRQGLYTISGKQKPYWYVLLAASAMISEMSPFFESRFFVGSSR